MGLLCAMVNTYLVANDLVCNECNYRDANIDPGDVPTEFHYTQ